MANRNKFARHRGVRGQATIEFVVALLVAIPFFYLIPMLAKHFELQFRVQEASRYGAWEHTIYSPDQQSSADFQAQVSQQINDRFFRHPLNGIGVNDTSSSNQLMKSASGESLAQTDANGIALSVSFSEQDTVADTKLSNLETFNGFVGEVEASQRRFDDGKMRVVEVSVPLESAPTGREDYWLIDNPGAAITSTAAIMSGDWVPENENDFREVVRELSVAADLDTVEPLGSPYSSIFDVLDGFGVSSWLYNLAELDDLIESELQTIPDELSTVLPDEAVN